MRQRAGARGGAAAVADRPADRAVELPLPARVAAPRGGAGQPVRPDARRARAGPGPVQGRQRHATGTRAGDAVLAEFARRIRVEIREVDLAFRQGGEEFVVLLPETDAHGRRDVAERLGAAVREHADRRRRPDAAGRRSRVAITVSIGIAVYPDHGTHRPGGARRRRRRALRGQGGRARHATAWRARPASDPYAVAERDRRTGGREPGRRRPSACRRRRVSRATAAAAEPWPIVSRHVGARPASPRRRPHDPPSRRGR